MGLMSRVAATVLLAGVSLSAAGESVWFSTGDTVYRVDASSNQGVAVSHLGPLQSLVLDPREGAAWALSGNRLFKINQAGVAQVDLDLKGLGIQFPTGLTFNPYERSLWLADGKTLLKLGPEGQALGNWVAPGIVRTLALGVDENLWALGNKQLWRYSGQGALVASQNLTGLLKEEPKFLAVDSLGEALWLAGEKQLVKFSFGNLGQVAMSLDAAQIVTGLALDSKRGTLWVLAKDNLTGITRDGQTLRTINLAALAITGASALAFEPASESLWVGHGAGLARFTPEGELAASLATGAAVSAVGVAPFVLTPTVNLLRPPQNALTNNPRPEFALGFDALCSGASCGFAPSYFGTYGLSALLNDQPVGAFFAFDPTTGQSSYTPGIRLPEGENRFSATVTERFGHASEPVTNTFTVDTIPPRFLTLSPVDGSVLSSAQALIQGTVDDPTATVILEGVGPATSQVAGSGLEFSLPVTLRPGPNTLTLTALDRASNSTTTSLRLSVATLTLQVQSPANGDTVAGDSVWVTGTFTGPANTGIAVNGVVATQDGNRFYAPVSLQLGINTVTVTATSPEGMIATQTLTVTSSGPSPIQIKAEPVSGIAPLKVAFSVVNNTGSTLTRFEADLDGNGTIDFATTNPNLTPKYTYAAPGAYQAKFTVRDAQNNTYTVTQIVVVQDAEKMDQMFQAIWGGMSGALAARDKAAALKYITQSSQARYGRIFDSLLPSLPAVVASLSSIKPAQFANTVGEYIVTRQAPDGTLKLFLIYFILDADGVWRIDSM